MSKPNARHPSNLPSPLLADVRQLIDAARQRVASAVNAELTQLYWHIGRRISVELLQGNPGLRHRAAVFRHCERSAAIHASMPHISSFFAINPSSNGHS